MRLRHGLTLAAALFALPAAAQDYGVITQAELDQSTGLTNVAPRCIVAFGGSAVFYDETSGGVVIYEPGGTDAGTLIGKSEIDALAGFEVDRCLDVDFDVEEAETFFVLGNDAEEVVLKFDGDGDAVSRLVAPDQAAGTYGIAASGGVVYLARVEFRDAPEDGVYRVSADGEDQTPEEVVTNADLDLLAIDVASDGDLYAVSSEFGEGDFANVIVRVEDPEGTPALSVVARPCEGDDPTFVDCTDGGIEELQVATIIFGDVGVETLIVSNNAFSSDVVVAAFRLDGTPIQTVFSGNALLADDDINEETVSVAFNAYMWYDEPGRTLYLAGRQRIDTDAEAIYFVTNFAPVANEPEALAAGMSIDVANPIASGAVVSYAAGVPGRARLEAFDLLGRRLAVLADGVVAGGVQRVRFDASALPTGTYVLRLTGEAGVVTRTVTVVR